MTTHAAGPFEIFVSYARRDDAPGDLGARGWVTALRDEILADHRRFSTEPLRIFFDTSDIRSIDDWRHRILEGLRHSRVLLVCLSPSYFASPYCRWEWEEYASRQVHAQMGQDSIAPVYFVEVPGTGEHTNAAGIAEWLAGTLRANTIDLSPWFPLGPVALREEAVRQKIAALGDSLWERIRRARRASGIPGNVRRLNPHFVGRTYELRRLHESLALGAIGVVTALNGLGGQGKTELAISYAHGWAHSYPAGIWVLGAEGRRELLPLLGDLAAELGLPLSVHAGESDEARGRRVLAELRRRALAARDADPGGGAACLVLLDNVSDAALLSEPEIARLPREDWLRVVATTRLGADQLAADRRKSLTCIEVDALAEQDTVRLLEDHQPGARWPAASAEQDAAAAREIARELGGFTLAIEAVALHLGLHPEIRPSEYLARLRREGLASADELGADADVAVQMHHREKQLALVLDATLVSLDAAARAALECAALLPPDSVPWPWLRKLVAVEYADDLAQKPGHPDPWSALRRRLEGLRLLTPGEHEEITRLHRLVGAHLRLRMKEERKALLARRISALLQDVGLLLQQTAAHERTHLWMLPPLQEAVLHNNSIEPNDALAVAAGVAGRIEFERGLMGRAGVLLELALRHHERIIARDPEDAQAAQHLAVALVNLADFLADRAQSGDAENALLHYERSLEVRERLLAANRKSAQAARDVSVGLNKIADFLTRRGHSGDTEKALSYYERSLEIDERLCEADPKSAEAARGLWVGMSKLAVFLTSRGHPGDAERSLLHYERSLEVCERLLEANPESAQAKRDVSVCLNNLAESLAKRGQSGDAEKVLSHYERSLKIREGLLEANRESTEAKRDVSVSLVGLGDALARRGQTGDAEKALLHYERSLELDEQMLKADPKSASAARDVLIALERLSEGWSTRPEPEAAATALELQLRAVDFGRSLAEANPATWFYVRTEVHALGFAYVRALAVRDMKLAAECLDECRLRLTEARNSGMQLDAPMLSFLAELESMRGGVVP